MSAGEGGDETRDAEKRRVQIVLRPMGNPLPLGFIGLFFGTAAFSTLQLNWIPPEQGSIVAVAVLAFSVPVQFVACVLGFLARDPIAGTGMGILTGTWATLGVATLITPPGTTNPGLGVVLILSGLAILIPAAAGTAKKLAVGVMLLSATRYIITGIAETSGVSQWMAVAGWTGLLLAVVAFYAALGFELEDVHKRAVVPVWRTGGAPGGDLDEETAEIEREAGIRSDL